MDGDRLDALLADAVAAEAAADRTKVRALRRAASEEATLVGMLVELAEAQRRVAVQTSHERVHRGVVVAVCRDAVVVADDDRTTVIRTAAITAVRTPRLARRDTAGARPHTVDVSFRSLLANLVDERPSVQVGVRGQASLTRGVLRAVGADVVTVDVDGGGDGRHSMLVPTDAIDEVVLLDT